MRKLITSTFVSVNGYFTGLKDEQEWTFPYLSLELRKWMLEEGATFDTIIMGKTTYSLLKNVWPNMTGAQDLAADFMNNTSKIIISSTLKDVEWGMYKNIRVIHSNVADELMKIKSDSGKNILVVGSGSVVEFAINEGLVDECEVTVMPIILKEGRPLFAHIKRDQALELHEVKTFADGVVMHRYLPHISP